MRELYEELLDRHGPQGWWPVHTADGYRYTPEDFSERNDEERFEIIIGAILTQNTNWSNVRRALSNLRDADVWDWQAILDAKELEEIIRPSGYYRQKARKLREAAAFFSNHDGIPSREALLGLWGVGPETADSILCYAYDQPVMVVDAYLRRVLKDRGHPEHALPYEELRAWVEEQLPADYRVLNEFHALIVAEAKALKA